MKEFILALDELDELCKLIPDEAVVLLRGDLASGKTSLVQAIARFKGVDKNITSPTFSLMQSYEAKGLQIYHYDIYQKGLEGILENGLFENFYEDGLHLVEWGDENLEKTLRKMGLKPLIIEITSYENKRKYSIK